MNIPFLANWLNRNETDRGASGLAAALADDPEGINELFAECEMLRAHARSAGLELDETPRSLEELDQLMPRWRRDPEITPWLGNDAGFYLGTVIIRSVQGAGWQVWPNGQPMIRLASGRELNVVESGVSWAMTGSPELSQAYAEASEG
ncbi:MULTISPECIES: DUF6278 family protein [unclassified Streptomyces]|uniref:DUF6278 family protein n=1 Tax=Streptomyces TaxID=1883 RepID=UPI000DC762FE|nr:MULTISPECIES: DUF6278 family protein [unclassified Streptomyces]AWZ06672.1 hypothetical protein DRB89_20900 [Streptomyces sp. ICC4]AWZ12947.1 hypothetical protein DRB96_12100 [Streptomyces sp. ICC1]